MTRKAYIYQLTDPRKPEFIRYVGKSLNPLNRLSCHIYESRRQRLDTYLYKWIRQLTSEGLRPELTIIEEVEFENDSSWGEREAYHIKRLREAGHKLTNHTDGGDGPSLTEATKAKLRAINLGKKMSPEACAKLSEAKKGKPYTEAQRKAALNRKPVSDLTRKKMSEARKGVPKSEVHKAKMRLNRHTEETKLKMSIRWSDEVKKSHSEKVSGVKHGKATPVIGTHIVTGEQILLDYMGKSKEIFGKNIRQDIRQCCKGIRKQARGYFWKYAAIAIYAFIFISTHAYAGSLLGEEAVVQARKYSYVREITNHNDAPEIDQFLAYIGLPKQLSWCAAYVIFSYKNASEILHVKQPLPKYGRVAMLWETCKRNPLKYRTFTADDVRFGSVQLQAGDIPIFAHGTIRNGDFNGHTGLVQSQLSNVKMQTIEGNTSSGNGGSQREGNGVFERTRTISPGTFRIIGFCRVRP